MVIFSSVNFAFFTMIVIVFPASDAPAVARTALGVADGFGVAAGVAVGDALGVAVGFGATPLTVTVISTVLERPYFPAGS